MDPGQDIGQDLTPHAVDCAGPHRRLQRSSAFDSQILPVDDARGAQGPEVRRSIGLAGTGHHLVPPRGEDAYGTTAHSASGTGDEDRSVARVKTAALESKNRQGSGEARCTDAH